MKEIKELLKKRDELKAQIAEIEATIEGIDSIRERRPHIEKIQELEEKVEDAEYEACNRVDTLISNQNSEMTFDIRLKVTPCVGDIDYEVDDLYDADTLEEFLSDSYINLIKDNIDGIIYSPLKVESIKLVK